MKNIIKHPQLLLLMIMILLSIHEKSFAQIKEFAGKEITQAYPKQLGKYLKKYSVYTIDLKEIAAYAKGNSKKAQFNLTLYPRQFKLEVELNEMRGKDFKAIAMTDKGPKELMQTFSNTYKGFENNNPSNIVRLNIDESTFEGYINIGKKWLYFDKLKRYIPDESNNKIVVYDGEDVIPDSTKKCGSEIIEAEKRRFNPKNNNQNSAVTSNCHFAEIATEADYEYYQAFSNNADAALSRIREILNLVEGLYTPPFDVKFIIRYQQIWTIIDDPYSGDSLQVILPQFRDWWNANMTSISRDVTHMFTGRTVKNTTIGLAYRSVVCYDPYYYSSVVNYSPVTNSTITLSAHELGHNFGATHDATCNGNNIMCSYIQDGTPEWSSKSLTDILNYINSSGSCMTESIPTDFTYFGNGTGVNYLKVLAANTITINSSSGAVELNSNGFGYMEAGTSIILAPTNSNSLGFLAPEGSTLSMRLSDVVNTCDPLTASRSSSSISKKQYSDLLPESNDVQIRPNPFTSSFELTISLNEDETVQVTIYNSIGVKVKEKTGIHLSKGFQKLSFDCSNLSNGIYILEVNFGHSKTVKKVVKM